MFIHIDQSMLFIFVFFCLGEASVNISFWSTSDFMDWFSCSIDHMESRHSLNSINLGWFVVDINVDFCQSDSSLSSFLVNIGTNSNTGSAPGCVEINNDCSVFCCEGQQFGVGICLDLSHLKISFINYNLQLVVYREYKTFNFWSIWINL